MFGNFLRGYRIPYTFVRPDAWVIFRSNLNACTGEDGSITPSISAWLNDKLQVWECNWEKADIPYASILQECGETIDLRSRERRTSEQLSASYASLEHMTPTARSARNNALRKQRERVKLKRSEEEQDLDGRHVTMQATREHGFEYWACPAVSDDDRCASNTPQLARGRPEWEDNLDIRERLEKRVS